MHQIVSCVIAAVPGSLVIYQPLNLPGVRGFLDRQRVLETDSERLLHPHMHAVSRAGFHYPPVIVSVCVNQNGLRMNFLQHLVQISKQNGSIESVTRRGLAEQMGIRLSDSHDLNLRTVAGLVEETVHVSMHQPNNGDAKWRLSRRCRERKLSKQERE